MSSVTSYAEQISQVMTNYVATNHTTKYAMGGGLLCASAAVELGLRVLQNLAQAADPASRDEKFGETVSRNFGGMVLFGACATNAIPGLAALGAIVLIGNALLGDDSDDALVITKIMRTCRPLASEVGTLAWKITKAFVEAAFNILKAVLDVIYAILSPIGSALGHVFLAVLPKTPEGVAAVAVVGSIAIYKFYTK